MNERVINNAVPLFEGELAVLPVEKERSCERFENPRDGITSDLEEHPVGMSSGPFDAFTIHVFSIVIRSSNIVCGSICKRRQNVTGPP